MLTVGLFHPKIPRGYGRGDEHSVGGEAGLEKQPAVIFFSVVVGRSGGVGGGDKHHRKKKNKKKRKDQPASASKPARSGQLMTNNVSQPIRADLSEFFAGAKV